MNLTKITSLAFALAIFFNACATKKTYVKPIVKTKVLRDTVFVKSNMNKDTIAYAKNIAYDVDFNHFPSPNQNNRIRFLVMHYTNADFDRSVKLLTGQIQREVSSHYLVNEIADNKIHLLVNEENRSWHAGRSYWNGRDNLNDTSIGIEIVNIGFENRQGQEYWFEYPKHQIKKVGELAKDIVKRYGIDPTNVIGHSDVAPQRKFDPGPKFPWKLLYDQYSVGAWYDSDDKYRFQSEYNPEFYTKSWFIKNVQQDFNKYGYKIEPTGEWDNQTKNVIVKFQHHFRPQNFDGVLDAETWAILKALIKKYRN